MMDSPKQILTTLVRRTLMVQLPLTPKVPRIPGSMQHVRHLPPVTGFIEGAILSTRNSRPLRAMPALPCSTAKSGGSIGTLPLSILIIQTWHSDRGRNVDGLHSGDCCAACGKAACGQTAGGMHESGQELTYPAFNIHGQLPLDNSL